MKTNTKNVWTKTTHEGALAAHQTKEVELRRSVMTCMLWEDTFYENGVLIADRIKDLVPEVAPHKVAQIAVEARSKMKLRHVPLWIVRHMAKLPNHKGLVADTLEKVIQRPDELGEFLNLYWSDKRQPLSAQVKKGLRRTWNKFSAYSMAKYNQDNKVKLRDVAFLTHPKPPPEGEFKTVERKYPNGTVKQLLRHEQSTLAKLINGTLETPDTWEVALSGGSDKKATFERLIEEKKLGALAFLRNLRNMEQAGVDRKKVEEYSKEIDTDRVLPFRFISAARAVPAWEPMIEQMMLRSLDLQERLPGRTVIVVDNSGSMYGPKVSAKSDIDRIDAACALAILVREISEDPVVIGFGSTSQVLPARRGFALRDVIRAGPGGGTNTQYALDLAEKQKYDRIIVITDEQSAQTIKNPLTDKAYFINVASYQNGIAFGKWTSISGWSEAVIEYIKMVERPMDPTLYTT